MPDELLVIVGTVFGLVGLALLSLAGFVAYIFIRCELPWEALVLAPWNSFCDWLKDWLRK